MTLSINPTRDEIRRAVKDAHARLDKARDVYDEACEQHGRDIAEIQRRCRHTSEHFVYGVRGIHNGKCGVYVCNDCGRERT